MAATGVCCLDPLQGRLATQLVSRQAAEVSSVRMCLSCRVASQVATPFLGQPAS